LGQMGSRIWLDQDGPCSRRIASADKIRRGCYKKRTRAAPIRPHLRSLLNQNSRIGTVTVETGTTMSSWKEPIRRDQSTGEKIGEDRTLHAQRQREGLGAVPIRGGGLNPKGEETSTIRRMVAAREAIARRGVGIRFSLLRITRKHAVNAPKKKRKIAVRTSAIKSEIVGAGRQKILFEKKRGS